MNVILLGPPGCGKGTQGALLAKELGAPRVSTGDLLRAAVKDGTPLGVTATGFMDKGLLVPDEVILGLISEVLARPEAGKGILMDGFPRTTAQADAVGDLLAKRGTQVDAVLSLEVPDAELVTRMQGRAAAEGRADDKPDAFNLRLKVYREQTAPLIAYYRERGKLKEVAGMGTVEEIARAVRKALGL
ncbi:MAG: adenylate kinase [Gemmatimonadetes bacterium]|nr:adenylate kinase [Gemmatimonadota bacterium]